MTLIGKALSAPVCWIPVYRIHADTRYGAVKTKLMMRCKSAAWTILGIGIASGSDGAICFRQVV